jgi:hypothetical protein
MLYSVIIPVCSEIHTNTLCRQDVKFLNVKHVEHKVTLKLKGLILPYSYYSNPLVHEQSVYKFLAYK